MNEPFGVTAPFTIAVVSVVPDFEPVVTAGALSCLVCTGSVVVTGVDVALSDVTSVSPRVPYTINPPTSTNATTPPINIVLLFMSDMTNV